MKKLKNFLLQIGFSHTEVSVYIKGLALKRASASELAKYLAVPRTTVYSVLESLVKKGLVSKELINQVAYFIFQEPDWLTGFFDRKIQELNQQKTELQFLLEDLEASSPSNERIQAEYFEGVEAVKQAVEQALYSRKREWEIIAPAENFFSKIDPLYARYFISQRKLNRIKARSLWETKRSRSLTLEEIAFRQPRILPKTFLGKFRSTMILFDDKILLLSSREPYSAVLVTSVEFRELMTVMFEGLWQVSEPYIKLSI